ncbi:MAG: hypothetical protein GQ534_01420 [Candidatus Delongbacteria bacterium]|nr:hypothetical protein [Candidatus Delongbacteria bacterium]
MRKKLELFNIRTLDVFSIILLTIVTYFSSATVLGISLSVKNLSLILITRLFLSLIIFNDHELSWSRSTSRSYLTKATIGIVAFTLYAPVLFATLLHPIAAINTLALELGFYLSIQITLMYSYKHIIKISETQKEVKIAPFGVGKPMMGNSLK